MTTPRIRKEIKAFNATTPQHKSFFVFFTSSKWPFCKKFPSNIIHISSHRKPHIITIVSFQERTRWAGHVARIGEKRNAYRILAGKPEGKRPLGRPRRRWLENIKMDLREIRWDEVDWIDMA
jgi:hypothetical protein